MTRYIIFHETAPPPTPLKTLAPWVTFLIMIFPALLFIFILAGFVICDRICRYHAGVNSSTIGESPPSPNRGLKREALQSLPKSSPCFSTECAICLTEFSVGEEIEVLPMCSHTFHVACIDEWLTYSSSCPSCRRRVLVPVMCHQHFTSAAVAP
ncbi:unnamed protein product [Microthlaspi erraticum]|uniref:RING-type domain-containing protein n=1 Tax=Microthlaspi erraticum TaxID=1685480 RepID=A0A6D2J0X4_9BRAS|nr:unnamed protein product [Microthlaspi erraticum]